MSIFYNLLLFSAPLFLCEAQKADPTDGFVPVPLTEYNFNLQKPYDTPLEERYSFINGTRRLWVYADDKPHNVNSPTQPRAEVRIHVSTLPNPSLTWRLGIQLHVICKIFCPNYM